MPKMTPSTVNVAGIPQMAKMLAQLTVERERARALAAALEDENARLASAALQEFARLTTERDEAMKEATTAQAELVTARRERDAARAEVAHRDATMRGGGW